MRFVFIDLKWRCAFAQAFPRAAFEEWSRREAVRHGQREALGEARLSGNEGVKICPATCGGAVVLLEDGEDVLVPQPRDELQRQCGSHLLVLVQKSSRLMMSDSFEVSAASLTMVTLLLLPKGGLARTMSYSPCFAASAVRLGPDP